MYLNRRKVQFKQFKGSLLSDFRERGLVSKQVLGAATQELNWFWRIRVPNVLVRAVNSKTEHPAEFEKLQWECQVLS